MPRDVQLLLATFIFVASAELRVSKRSTFTGQESTWAAVFGAWNCPDAGLGAGRFFGTKVSTSSEVVEIP